MSQDWQQLTALTGGKPMCVERVRLEGADVAVEGSFELPPLARLSAEDQVFVAAFVRSHGSIKEMEDVFGVSYPTIKNRLRRIAQQLELVEMRVLPVDTEILLRLDRGEISAEQAIQMLRQQKGVPSQ